MKQDIADFELDRAAALSRKRPDCGPIERIFYEGPKVGVHKWLHYLPIYDRAFASLDKSTVHMLEIGVARGGSLQMWREFFGSEATIFGIDINPECSNVVSHPNQVRIGSQADPNFLRSVVSDMRSINVVLDDGSHLAEHQIASFRTLFPLLDVGGLYIIEDLHTAYWPGFGGGLRRPGSAIELVKALIDDMHAWYHSEPETWAPRTQVGAIHLYDSIAIIEKADLPPPAHYVSQAPVSSS